MGWGRGAWYGWFGFALLAATIWLGYSGASWWWLAPATCVGAFIYYAALSEQWVLEQRQLGRLPAYLATLVVTQLVTWAIPFAIGRGVRMLIA